MKYTPGLQRTALPIPIRDQELTYGLQHHCPPDWPSSSWPAWAHASLFPLSLTYSCIRARHLLSSPTLDPVATLLPNSSPVCIATGSAVMEQREDIDEEVRRRDQIGLVLLPETDFFSIFSLVLLPICCLDS
uniref:Uncharacterized protein n=1 Tax=Arundo donax TaxID=35708 RepID=A0A0A8XRN0_ARUDO